jgi:hypothetical protein
MYDGLSAGISSNPPYMKRNNPTVSTIQIRPRFLERYFNVNHLNPCSVLVEAQDVAFHFSLVALMKAKNQCKEYI